MKRFIVFLLVCVVCSTVFAKERFYYKGVTWGMTGSQVQKKAGKPGYNKDGTYGYYSNVVGIKTFVYYDFIYSQLKQIRIMTSENHYNSNKHIQEYELFKKLLTSKYGKPVIDTMIWSNNLYKGDVSNYGLAISIGHMYKGCLWKFPGKETTITLTCDGAKYRVTTQINYTHSSYKKLYEKYRQEKANTQL